MSNEVEILLTAVTAFAVFGLGFVFGESYEAAKRDKHKPLSESAEQAARALGVAPERKRPYSERENAWGARHGEVRRG